MNADADHGFRLIGRLALTLVLLVTFGLATGAAIGYVLSRTVALLLGLV
jgi:hypothetical protein